MLDPNRVELRQLSVEEIGKMLKNHSLGLYEDIFSTNCVDGETLTVWLLPFMALSSGLSAIHC